MYSTRVHVYTRASLTDILAMILARKIARVGQVGEDPRACPARGERSYSCGKLNREVAEHADILATILARKSARMSASVHVRVSPVYQLIRFPYNGRLQLSVSGYAV